MSKEEFESISKETYVLGMARKERVINDLVFLYENCNILNNECVRGIIDKTIKSIKHEFEEHLKLKEKVDSVQSLLGEVDMFVMMRCIIDYDRLYSNNSCFPIKKKFRILTDKDYDKLSPLIDNKPYEFEELKTGMWVWDDEYKWYFKIHSTDINKDGLKTIDVYVTDSYIGTEIFKENRFYPREVK